MPIGIPPEEVISLYDRLITLPFSEVKEISSIQAKLLSIKNQNPTDVGTLVALLQTYTMLGNAKEAIRLSEHIWRRGGDITPYIEASYMDQLVHLGMYDWCLTLALPKLEADPDFDILYPPLFNSAVGIGDLKLLERIITLNYLGEESDIVKLFIQHIREAGLEQHIAEQQKIINGILRGKQTAYEVLIETERGWPELEIGIFVGGDSVDRYQIQVAVDKAQREYYESVGISPLENMMTTIYDVKEHWPPQGPNVS